MTRTKPANPSYQSVREAVAEADAPERKGDANVDNGLATVEAAGPIAPRVAPAGMADVPIGVILAAAIERGTPVDQLKEIVALHERTEDRHKAEEFARAKAQFQAAIRPIRKTSTARITSKRTGSSYAYNYAELDTIAEAIRKPLTDAGLSYSWDSTVSPQNLITCVCTVRHVNGHAEKASFVTPLDGNDSMSAAQQAAASLTFARRQSLIQVLGLTTCDPDNDGNAPDGAGGKAIDDNQAANMEHALAEVNGDKVKFLAHFGVPTIAAIPAARFKEAMGMIERKRKAQAGGAA